MEIVVCEQTQQLDFTLEQLILKLEQLNLKPIDPARIELAV
jgi:hypothetical protein